MKLEQLQLSAEGGIVSAEFGYALAISGKPQYVEYNCLNKDGTSAFFLNGITGYRSTRDACKGIALITCCDQEMMATCSYHRDEAIMSVEGRGRQFECRWDEASDNKSVDKGKVVEVLGSDFKELYYFRGQSQDQELDGKVIKHELFAGSKLIGYIYPSGSWKGGLKLFVNRWFRNRIVILEYNDHLFRLLHSSAEREMDSLFTGLATSLLLHRPLTPFFG